MITLFIHWILSAAALIIVAQLFKGFQVRSFGSALVAAIIIGVVNATVGWFFTILTLPLSILSFGIFLWVVDAFMLKLSSLIAPGFEVKGVGTVFFGAIILSILNTLFRWGYSMSPWKNFF